MTASTNATRVFWGTAWTSSTLLERQRRYRPPRPGKGRHPAPLLLHRRRCPPLVHRTYGDHVDRVIAEHGRNHPLVRTQYFCETIDAQSGMFTPARIALIFPSRGGFRVRQMARIPGERAARAEARVRSLPIAVFGEERGGVKPPVGTLRQAGRRQGAG